MDKSETESPSPLLRLLIKRPSWGYSKEDRNLMTGEQKFQHIYNPVHEAGIIGGMYMQLQTPGGEPETYIFRPSTKSMIALVLSTTALKLSTALTYPGKIYRCTEPIFYDDEIEYRISPEQYASLRAELVRGDKKLFNYAVHDSGIYFTKLAAAHGVRVPDLGRIAPLEFYRTATDRAHTFSQRGMLTLFPKDAAGFGHDGSGGRIKSFRERMQERDLKALVKAAGEIC